jgi:hypothetical protein
VAILNKLEGGKNCLRDFDGLVEKMSKIGCKDLKNRFIVSGINTVITVSQQKNIYDVVFPLFSLTLLTNSALKWPNCNTN